MKVFCASWFAPAYEDTDNLFDEKHFVENNGYDKEDVAVIQQLDVGETYWMESHKVVRIR